MHLTDNLLLIKRINTNTVYGKEPFAKQDKIKVLKSAALPQWNIKNTQGKTMQTQTDTVQIVIIVFYVILFMIVFLSVKIFSFCLSVWCKLV